MHPQVVVSRATERTDQVSPDRVGTAEGVGQGGAQGSREFSLPGPSLLSPRLEQWIWSSRDPRVALGGTPLTP